MPSIFRPDQIRYELEQKLGEGLSCHVWRAGCFDASGERRRTVALKLPKDQTSVPVLRREFDLLTRINSLYCVRVIAWETCGDQPAIAMEWIDGVTLYEFSQKVLVASDASGHRGDDAQTIDAMIEEIARQIFLGLEDLRAAGLFHGDLQPKNVMIDRDGRVRLIDFASGHTPEGCLQATPAFLSPEIWSGAPLSYEGDLFALRVIRDHLKEGFKNLPRHSQTQNPRSFKPASENRGAQARLAVHVSRLLAAGSELSTQVIPLLAQGPQDLANEAHLSTRAHEWMRHPAFFKTAAALSLVLIATLPVLAEAPAHRDEGTANLQISSESWMEIEINGRRAGFAPITLRSLEAGTHRVSWKSSRGHGELRLTLNRGATLRLTESRQRIGQLEVR